MKRKKNVPFATTGKGNPQGLFFAFSSLIITLFPEYAEILSWSVEVTTEFPLVM